MKTCRICKEEKQLSEFYLRSPGRYRNECKDCSNSIKKLRYQEHREECCTKQRAYYYSNKNECLARNKKYYEENPNVKAYYAEYREQHRDENREYFKQHYQDNAERIKTYKKAYRSENRDKIRAWNNQRKALLRDAPGRFTSAEWSLLKQAYKYRCAYCGEQFNRLTMDHVVPLARGGSHTIFNIVPACMSCNNHKKLNPAPPVIVTPDSSLMVQLLLSQPSQ